jgi:hypothetical protein
MRSKGRSLLTVPRPKGRPFTYLTRFSTIWYLRVIQEPTQVEQLALPPTKGRLLIFLANISKAWKMGLLIFISSRWEPTHVEQCSVPYSGGRLPWPNTRTTRKYLNGRNTLAYSVVASVTRRKSYIRLTPGLPEVSGHSGVTHLGQILKNFLRHDKLARLTPENFSAF